MTYCLRIKKAPGKSGMGGAEENEKQMPCPIWERDRKNFEGKQYLHFSEGTSLTCWWEATIVENYI